jgi:serpin B
MEKAKFWLASWFALSLFAGCASAGEAPASAPVAPTNQAFACDLYGRLAAGDANLFFSPHSISSALVMALLGAEGETQAQMYRTLGLPQRGRTLYRPYALAHAYGALRKDLVSDGEAYVLRTANALWLQEDFPFKPDFLRLNREQLGADARNVDFRSAPEEARERINAWVTEKTEEKITDLIAKGALGPRVRLVLTNAVYFKGTWQDQFDPTRTRQQPFTTIGGDKVSVAMMSRTGAYPFAAHEEALILELPYEGERLAMLVLLPGTPGPEALAALEAALTPERLQAWIHSLRKSEVAVSLPRFEMTWGVEELKDELQALGMKTAFTDDADFTGMTEAERLYLDSVVHKAYVKVNEEGAEAAAATGAVMRVTAMPPQFRADRPFLFLIRDRKTETILFMGRVMNPA